jgi:predicted Zn-ribbon and HTH transcriptional regulator
MKQCKNCGFKFNQGILIPSRGIKHPNAYFNPMSPITTTPFVTEVCPKCGSDAIEVVD